MDASKTLATIIARRSRPVMKSRLLAIDLNKTRQSKQQRLIKTHVNAADIQIFGGESNGYCPSVIVSSEGKSYLFNCPESFQRTCISEKLKFAPIEDVFITNHKWNRMSGLYGLALSLQDIGAVGLNVKANERAHSFFGVPNPFIALYTSMRCIVSHHSANDFVSSGLRVSSIIIHSTKHNDISSGPTAKRIKALYDLVAFICTMPDQPGHLDPEKCRRMGVPIGPLLAELKSGRDVTLPNGTLIKSVDVVGPIERGIKFIILECPDVSMIDHFVDNATLNDIKTIEKSEKNNHISFVVHMCPKEVTSHPKYRDWIDGFHKDCKHLLANNHEFGDEALLPVYRLNYTLNALDEEIFPLLKGQEDLRVKVQEELKTPYEDRKERLGSLHEVMSLDKGEEFFTNQKDNIIHVEHGQKFTIRPHKSYTFPDKTLNLDRFISSHDEVLSKIIGELKSKQNDLPKAQEYEPEIVFLGTASAVPTKYRNVTGILVNLYHPKKLSIIMDCGEGTLPQMIRLYGQEKTDEILRQVRLIMVSHQHPDHHLGLLSLLERRATLTKEPVALILPPQVENMVEYFDEYFTDLSSSYEIFKSGPMKMRQGLDGKLFHSDLNLCSKKDLMDKISDFVDDLNILPVDHCVASTAFVINFKIGHPKLNFFKLAFSGDCRPSEHFAEIGKDCDLLIHEATFDHRQEEDAVLKKHCTTHEAIQVSKKMGAKFTILTHFSARFSRMPNFTEMFDDKIGFSFDHMTLRCPSQLPRVPILKDALSNIFAEDVSKFEGWLSSSRQKEEFRKVYLSTK